ncbi:hypothetical protein R1flu_022559 [Riccia fluitans]|uniref:SPX domain-containing protein n=1 Tax=Riccia fluitans TaxID=41844 RepID=A0ABD1XPI9_9MARC
MVKFLKHLEGQLVPEWRTAYVNYKNMKKELKLLKQKPREVYSGWRYAVFQSGHEFQHLAQTRQQQLQQRSDHFESWRCFSI